MTTAIVISCNEQTALTALALDAIDTFTREPHEVVLVMSTPSRKMHRDMQILADRHRILWRINRPRVWPWYSSPKKYAGLALADAFQASRATLGTQVETIFFMHNDALPVRLGWLSYLQSKLTPDTAMVGVKASERNGAPHSSGVLFDAAWLATLPDGALEARMPAWDVAEWPASRTQAWSARSWCQRPGHCAEDLGGWYTRFPCDISRDDTGMPFYLHRGGGTWLGSYDIAEWVAACRHALGLA